MKLKPKKCDQCGKTFMPRTYSQRFCSPVCSFDAAAAKRKPIPTAVCPVCGKTYAKRLENQKTCGQNRCINRLAERRRLESIRSGAGLIEFKCVVCGKPFKSSNKKARCCSKKCRSALITATNRRNGTGYLSASCMGAK